METYNQSAAVLRALAHPARLQMLDLLRHGPLCVCHLEQAVGKRQAYVSQQLMVLREAGLVETERKGVQIYYHLSDPTIPAILTTLLGSEPQPLPNPLLTCQPPYDELVQLPVEQIEYRN